MSKDPKSEPFIAPSNDPPELTKKKVLAGKGLAYLLVGAGAFMLVIWLLIWVEALTHSN
jgi:hypothetical protein